jgi:hypothetical protein
MSTDFYRLVEDAIRDVEVHGYDSQARIDSWLLRIEQAARASATPEHVVQATLNSAMQSIYGRMVDRGGFIKTHKGISKFTVERLKPKLRSELDRRTMASAQLIKLNRDRMLEETKQRFMGWSTSIPKGGSRAVDRRAVNKNVRKAFQQLPFEERRVLTDQGHKFVSELSNIIATDGGAIAAVWNSHFRQSGYHYRPDHKDRTTKTYAIRGSWAMNDGLINKGDGYTDEITKPGEEVSCRCFYTYIYNLRDLPPSMLTAKGEKALASVQI